MGVPSSLDGCAANPECAAVVIPELATSVSAPSGAGFGASTLSPSAGPSIKNAVAGIAVVSATGFAGVVAWHYWDQASNEAAQQKAKEKYAAANPDAAGGLIHYTGGGQSGCGSDGIVYTRTIPGKTAMVGTTQYAGCTWDSLIVDGEIKDIFYPGTIHILSTKRSWDEYSQAQRNAAVQALDNSDWATLIPLMPEGGKLIPGDTINAPQIVIPGQETDDPNTPEDERQTRKVPGPYTWSGSSPSPSPSPTIPDGYPNPIPSPSPSGLPSPSPTPSPSPSPSDSSSPSAPTASGDSPDQPPDDSSSPPEDTQDHQTPDGHTDPGDRYLGERAKEIAKLMDDMAQKKRTIAVARVRNPDGVEEQVVASSNGYFNPA